VIGLQLPHTTAGLIPLSSIVLHPLDPIIDMIKYLKIGIKKPLAFGCGSPRML
jgi:hypothetical protein